jgi:hypothetical protein
MTHDDLKPEQWAAVKGEFASMLRYLGRLNQRLNKRKFPPHDPLVDIARDAYNALTRRTQGFTT